MIIHTGDLRLSPGLQLLPLKAVRAQRMTQVEG